MTVDSRKRGMILAVYAYILWGCLPIYWKLLKAVPAFQILCHRIIWSVVFLFVILLYKKNLDWIPDAWQRIKTRKTYAGTASILALNWMTYIWAVNHNYIVETSLGYFINPLISVLLGVIFLKERLRLGQWVSIGVAFFGVLFLTVRYGTFPWIALILALTFGFYGLIRKRGDLESVEGVSFETAFLFVPAFIGLQVLGFKGESFFFRGHWTLAVLLAGTGIATAFPLLLFNSAAKKIPLSSIGVLQYIAPSLQFLLGVFVYHESFTSERLVGFILIWIALFIYTFENLLKRHGRSHLR